MTDSSAAYDEAAQAFVARHPKSRQLHEKACQSLPGGNVRTVLHYHPFPLSIERGHDATIIDVDGHEYVDLLGEYTAGLYGHSDPVIKAAIIKAIEQGISYGGQHENEHRLAALIKQRFPSIELLRFTNSGTEANLMNMALACAHTGKKKIVVFSGGYHGGVFSWKLGKGSPINAPHQFLVARYNDIESVKKILAVPENAHDLAAIVLEPMIGSGGGMVGSMEFLKEMRRLADSHDALLIYDEVMTSRFFAGGGYQSQLSSEYHPDLTSLGKYVGGGMSFGAFGGKATLMSLFDPRHPERLSHAGTFNNNLLTMSAGCAGLEHVFTPARAEELHKTGDELREELNRICQHTMMQWLGCGSILCVHFTNRDRAQISAPDDVADADDKLAGLFHLTMLENGYYIGRRGFLALSLALTQEQLDGFVAAVQRFIQTHLSLIAMN